LLLLLLHLIHLDERSLLPRRYTRPRLLLQQLLRRRRRRCRRPQPTEPKTSRCGEGARVCVLGCERESVRGRPAFPKTNEMPLSLCATTREGLACFLPRPRKAVRQESVGMGIRHRKNRFGRQEVFLVKFGGCSTRVETHLSLVKCYLVALCIRSFSPVHLLTAVWICERYAGSRHCSRAGVR
jgi:hypothetical protein